jgi:hypothetical protein
VPTRTGRILAIASLALIGTLLAGWCAIFAKYGVDVPIRDQWYTPLHQLLLDRRGELSLSELARQHNEARKVVPNLISIALARAAGHYDTQVELFVGPAVFCGIACALAAASRRALGAGATAAAIAWLTALAWSPHTAGFHLFSITFERLLPELALAIALALFATRGPTLPCALAAAVLAAAAQYSFPSGIAVWALLLLYLALVPHPQRGRAGRAAVLIAGAAAVVCWLYFRGYAAPAQHSALAESIRESPWRLGEFVVAFLGNAFCRDRPWCDIAGAVALAAYSWFAVRFVRLPPPEASRPAEAVWLVMGAYSIAQAAVAAVARLPMGLDHATRPDYVLHGVYLPAAVAGLALARAHGAARERRAVAVVLAAFAWAAPLLGEGFWDDLVQRQRARRHARACAVLHRLYFEESCWSGFLSPPSIARRMDEAAPLLRPAPIDRLEFSAPGTGGIESAWRREDVEIVNGWAASPGEPADAVVLTVAGDPERIVAVVELAAPPSGGILRTPARGARESWKARVSGAIDPCSLRAYAFDASTATLQPLAAADACARRPPSSP